MKLPKDMSDKALSKEVGRQLKSSGIDLEDGDSVFILPDSAHRAFNSFSKNASALFTIAKRMKHSASTLALAGKSELEEMTLADSLQSLVKLELPSNLNSFQSDAKSLLSLFLGVSNQDSIDAEMIEKFKGFGVKKAFLGDVVSSMLRKAEENKEEHFVLGVVLEPTDGTDGSPEKPDTDGDIYSAEEVRQAAHWYMEFGRKKGLLHGPEFGGIILDADDHRIVVLESYITPVDIPAGTFGDRQVDLIKSGTWLWAIRINDEFVWEDVKEGRLDGLSIGGVAHRTLLE